MCWKLYVKNLFYVYFKMLDEMKESLPPKIIQDASQMFFFSLPKMDHRSMISPLYFNQKIIVKTRSQHTCKSCLHFFIELS
jgi:hypothetical protein